MDQKEFQVDDFEAKEGEGFAIEVKDKDGNLLKSVQLNVIVDDGDEQTIKPEDDGTLKVTPQPKDKLTITGVGS
jgi:hypothetical protein